MTGLEENLVLELEHSLELETLVDRARRIWRDASYRASTGRLELYAKIALRWRATRDLEGRGATFDRVLESGLAARVFQGRHDRAGFAAASGFSSAVARWVVDTACAHRAQAIALTPTPSDSVDDERWDLDPKGSPPSVDTLTEALVSRPHIHWLEAGTTAEILIGADGWLAARTRHRFWALGGGRPVRLVAQRGFLGWEHLLVPAAETHGVLLQTGPDDLDAIILNPEAAAPVVASLTEAFHSEERLFSTRCGVGWGVVDDPLRLDGLAGGTFDDAGFPAAPRTLAADCLWVDRLEGPGTLRRPSFREPPVASASNLVINSSKSDRVPPGAKTAQRCRVLPVSPDVWVLELEFADRGEGDGSRSSRSWLRVRPDTLISACAAGLGKARVTATGPIVPALLFEGLANQAVS